MQATLLRKAQETGEASINPNAPQIPDDFQRPVFYRSHNLRADIFDSIFALTENDLAVPDKDGKKHGSDSIVKKTFRIVIVKPLRVYNAPHEVAVITLRNILMTFPVRDYANNLFVCTEDTTIPRGAISIQHGPDPRSARSHVGVARVAEALRNTDFIKLRISVGAPASDKPEDMEAYLKSSFSTENQETDLLGHSLDISGQAIQSFLTRNDIKYTKIRYANTRKLPAKLRPLPGVVFPIEIDMNIARAEVRAALASQGVLPLNNEAAADAESKDEEPKDDEPKAEKPKAEEPPKAAANGNGRAPSPAKARSKSPVKETPAPAEEAPAVVEAPAVEAAPAVAADAAPARKASKKKNKKK
nr:hypothetical protein HK105_007745 [Polyrhizophydium stewartii]